MKYVMLVLLIVALVGCKGVDDVPPEAYTAMAESCKAEKKELHVRKTISIVELSCK